MDHRLEYFMIHTLKVIVNLHFFFMYQKIYLSSFVMIGNSVLFSRTQFSILIHATATSDYNVLIVYIKISSLSIHFLQFTGFSLFQKLFSKFSKEYLRVSTFYLEEMFIRKFCQNRSKSQCLKSITHFSQQVTKSIDSFCYKGESFRNVLPPKAFAPEFLHGDITSEVFSLP